MDGVFTVSEPSTYRLAADALRLQEPYEDEPSVFLTGRARAREFKYREMGKPTKNLFHKAMTQEWTSFQNFDALRPLTKEEINYVKKHNVTPTKMRWVLTDKNERLRVSKPNLHHEGEGSLSCAWRHGGSHRHKK